MERTQLSILSGLSRFIGMIGEMFLLHLQAAELVEYSAKITLLEEAKRSKEEEAESWHSKVSFRNGPNTSRDVHHLIGVDEATAWKDMVSFFYNLVEEVVRPAFMFTIWPDE